MEQEQIAIKISHVTKTYKLYDKPADRLKESLHPFKKKYHRTFNAVKDVTLEIHRGETVGIIGKNGSGKSTLLKMVTGVLTPTSGTIQVEGKVSALLELGAGFNPEYTGIENIYLNGTIMGYSKEQMDRKLDGILAFADIGDFVHQPVKMYSSGMFARLAFAVAINVDPDILIVDEALSVGDVSFQNKCYRKFESLRENGKTILFVTHSLDLITRYCDQAFLILEGEVVAQGAPKEVVNIYTRMMTSSKSIESGDKQKLQFENVNFNSEANWDESFFSQGPLENFHNRRTYNKNEYRWGDGRATVLDYLLMTDNEQDPVLIQSNQNIDLYVKYLFHQDVDHLICGVVLKTLDGMVIFEYNTRLVGLKLDARKPGDILIVKFSFPVRLNANSYFISVGCSEDLRDTGRDVAIDRRMDSIILSVSHPLNFSGIIDSGIQFDVVQVQPTVGGENA